MEQEVSELIAAIRGYFDRHQISNNINLLTWRKDKKSGKKLPLMKCVREFLEPCDGWNNNVLNTANDDDRCYFCKKNIAQLNPDLPLPRRCEDCYSICIDKYVKGEGFVLTAKKKKRRQKMS